ncbi:MAG: hypothetical protein K0S93_1062 [Nitrososphaeraceae archaeon]|jgi:hypothetical protein|nr:hypothetical protein [Nitrososphaeraceae archaeon]
MFWFNNTKKIEFDVNDLNVAESYKDKEGKYVSDKINDTIIEDDLLSMLYIKDDLLLMT